jgi:hypothetical protein
MKKTTPALGASDNFEFNILVQFYESKWIRIC